MMFDEDIEKARKFILSLEDDWDEEGARAFKEETFERVILIVKKILSLTKLTQFPNISPSSEGDIDIHWKNEKFELLIGIPEDPEEPFGYYGDDGKYNYQIEQSVEQAEAIKNISNWIIEMIQR